jgi:hypothetical protein
MEPLAEQDPEVEIEAQYALESPAKCPGCNELLRSAHVVRLLRTKVNFTSSLSRRGYAVVCPGCRTIITAAIG